MKKKIAIVDYGVGNLLSVWRAFKACDADVYFAKTPNDIKKADKIVLPGVGSFGNCLQEIQKRDLFDPIFQTLKSGKYFLGICVGMQILHNTSEEFGLHNGFGIIPGNVVKIPNEYDGIKHKIPFVGWAKVHFSEYFEGNNMLLNGIDKNNAFYFVHSFMGMPNNKNEILGCYNYNGMNVTAIVGKDNIFGCQFHPEKSGPLGLKLIQNFVNIGG